MISRRSYPRSSRASAKRAFNIAEVGACRVLLALDDDRFFIGQILNDGSNRPSKFGQNPHTSVAERDLVTIGFLGVCGRTRIGLFFVRESRMASLRRS